jgi:uncharacterized protein YkwD
MKLRAITAIAAVAMVALASVGQTQTTPVPQATKAPVAAPQKSQPTTQNAQIKAPPQAAPNTKAAVTQPAVIKSTTSQVKPAAFALHPIEQQVIDQTNSERARYGLPPLVADPQLIQSARAHGTWMARSRRMQHTSRPVAENIAMGQNSAFEAVRSWMSSSGHRANILSRGHRRIGVSAYTSSNGMIYWTQQFEP